VSCLQISEYKTENHPKQSLRFCLEVTRERNGELWRHM